MMMDWYKINCYLPFTSLFFNQTKQWEKGALGSCMYKIKYFQEATITLWVRWSVRSCLKITNYTSIEHSILLLLLDQNPQGNGKDR